MEGYMNHMRNAVLYSTATIMMAGCGIGNLVKKPSMTPKEFFDKSTDFKISYEAEQNMKKPQRLYALIHPEEVVDGELPDDIVAAMYREADKDPKDGKISVSESERYSLGAAQEHLESLPTPRWIRKSTD